jgi:hypothetical protein
MRGEPPARQSLGIILGASGGGTALGSVGCAFPFLPALRLLTPGGFLWSSRNTQAFTRSLAPRRPDFEQRSRSRIRSLDFSPPIG